MAVAAHRLNVMAALFLPLATISAVLGMNLSPTYTEYVSPNVLMVSVVVGSLILGAIIAGSLPKPSWLAEPDKLWPAWRL